MLPPIVHSIFSFCAVEVTRASRRGKRTETMSHSDGASRVDRPSRRNFLKTTSALAAAGALTGSLSIARGAHAAGNDLLRIGLVGCGGRGTGAAENALGADKNCKLVAMADAFSDRLKQPERL